MATPLRDNGWAGIVIYGAIRDCDEVDATEVGGRCLSTSPKKSAKDGYGHRDVPVSFGGVTFVPGQWAYCDGDGVLVSEEKLA